MKKRTDRSERFRGFARGSLTTESSRHSFANHFRA
jgi:hypothetical protein